MSSPRPVAPGRRLISLLVGAACLVTLAVLPAQAQQDVVAGAVVDARTLRPIANARITVEGTNLTATTDARGEFRIGGIRTQQATVIVVRIGYRPSVLQVVVGMTNIQVELTESALALDEIVVTGVAGALQKRAIGNAVVKIDAAEVSEIAPITSVADLINGRSPGVIIMPGTGVVGSGPRIQVRGRSSISLKGDPLVYVDGIRVSNEANTGPAGQGNAYISRIGDFNPDEIESIEIIKGPAAATLYGTEASNGVIQIITKKGTRGERPTFHVNVKQGGNWFKDASNRMDHNFSLEPDGSIFEQDLFAAEAAAGNAPFWTTGHIQGYGVNMSGGSEIIQYFVSADVDLEEGIEPQNSLQRISGRTNVTVTPNEKFDMQASLGFNVVKRELARQEGFSTMWGILFATPQTRATANRGFNTAPPETWLNIFQDFQDVDRFTGSVKVSHRPTDWFGHRLTVGLDQTSEDNQQITQRMTAFDGAFFGAPFNEGSKVATRRNLSLTTIDYNGSLDLNLSNAIRSVTTVGTQYYRNFAEFASATGQAFPVRGVTAVTATAIRLGFDNFVENKTFGFFVQQQFVLNDRLFLTGAVRADDNSSFGEDFDLIYYPKISGSWVVSDESFFNVGPIDALKLRAAWGASGQQPANFASLQIYAPAVGLSGPTVTPNAFGNPALAPERGEELELGFEAGLFDDRVALDFTWYNSRTKDAILLRDVAPSSGFPGQQFVNAGLITNKGIEALVNVLAVDAENVSVDFTFNFSTNYNKIIDIDPTDPSRTSIPLIYNRHEEGFPIAGWWRKKVVSADADALGNPINVLCDAGPGATPLPCTAAPEVFLGRPTPEYEGAFNTTVTLFKRLKLFALLDFKGGHKLFDVNTWARCGLFNQCEVTLNPSAFDPVRVAAATLSGGTVIIDEYLSPAKFMKLRELSVSYTLPNSWASKFGASRASITVAGRNLHTWTGYTGLDPESLHLPALDAPLFDLYFEQAQIPPLAQILAQINITF